MAIVMLLCGSFSANAQYDIRLNVDNNKGDTVLLCYYFLDNTYILDTCISKNGKFRFKGDKHIEDGIYFFVNTKQDKMCEFVLYKDRNITFKTKDDNWPENLEVKNSKNEAVYLDYFRKSTALSSEYRNIKNSLQNPADKKQADRLQYLTFVNDSLKEDFVTRYPDHMFSKILLCSKPVEPPQQQPVYTPEGTIDSVAVRRNTYEWYKLHYFDNIDLSCTGILYTPKEVFYTRYTDYWDKLLKYEKADSIVYYTEYVINKAQSQEVKQRIIYDVTKRYLTDNIMGHDKVYVAMVDKYFKTGIQTLLVPSDVQKNIERADKWRNLLLGQTLPDLACPEEDRNSAWHHLDELKSKYKILVFWSVDCSHCTTEIPKLSEFYKQYRNVYDLDVFAVHTEGDLQQMKEFVGKHGIEWVNTNGLFANYDWRDYFDIEKTPVIYILDSQDRILAKNISADNVKTVMEIIKNGGFDL